MKFEKKPPTSLHNHNLLLEIIIFFISLLLRNHISTRRFVKTHRHWPLERRRRRMDAPSFVVDHLILTTFLASLFAFLLLYLLRRRSSVNLNRSKRTQNRTLTVKSGNGVDIIIVGAGVAGAALAHTLGKVRSFSS